MADSVGTVINPGPSSSPSPVFHTALKVSNIRSLIPLILEKDTVQYSHWAELFRIHARTHRVLDHIDPTVPRPSNVDDELWECLDCAVKQWIFDTISPDLVHSTITVGSTALQTWTVLENLFQDNKTSRAIHFETEDMAGALNIEGLTDEMLTEILLRLPMREAHQCKAISRRWLSLISSFYFRRRYCSLHDNKNNFLLLVKFVLTLDGIIAITLERVFTEAANSLFVHVDFNNKLHAALGSRDYDYCSSLLFVSRDLFLISVGRPDYFMIYNGLTKKSLRLPTLPSSYYRGQSTLDTYRLEDNDFSGCLHSKDDPIQYKVVLAQPPRCVHNLKRDVLILDMFIFSSRSGDWSKFSITVPPDFVARSRTNKETNQYATICNGMLFWSHNMIIAYDPFDKPLQCDFIDFPDDSSSSVINATCITNVEGHIRLYSCSMTSTSTLLVWDLKDYTNRIWSKKYYVDLGGIGWPSTAQEVSIEGFNPFDGDVVYLHLSDRFVAMNLTSKAMQIIADLKPWNVIRSGVSRLFLYVPPSWPTPL